MVAIGPTRRPQHDGCALNASRVDELAPYRFGAPLEQANQIRFAHRRFDDQTIEQAAPFEVELQLSEAQHPLASGIVQSQVVRLELEGRWVETDRGHFKLRPQHVARLFFELPLRQRNRPDSCRLVGRHLKIVRVTVVQRIGRA